MEKYQILISFNKKVAEYGKPLSDKYEAQKKANKLISNLKPKGKFNVSVTVEKRCVKEVADE